MSPKTWILPAALAIASLAGCDYLGIESGAQQAASREAEGRAIGSACRQAGRALEDCYAYNPTSPKAAIFAGWKSMNDYMAENRLEVVKPQLEPKLPQPKRKAAEAGDGESEGKGGDAARSPGARAASAGH